MSLLRLLRVALLAALMLGASGGLDVAKAEAQFSAGSGIQQDPKVHYYKLLRRDPWKAAGWDLLLPGAGSFYVGLYVNTIIAAFTSVTGAALWIHGAVAKRDSTYYAGMSLFIAGRTYGLVAAPVGASMVNRALRAQMGIRLSATGFTLSF